MRVLITGATGLIGSRITQLCHQKGISINYLTTSKDKLEQKENFRGYYWNPAAGEIDSKCVDGVGAIINLAGENVFQPWTKSARKRILESRIDSLEVLHKLLSNRQHEVGQLISASAIGIYPSSLQKMHFEDETEIDDSFLAEVADKWEKAADKFNDLNLRVAKVRIGLVLSKKGGALAQMKKPVKYNVGAPLGSGNQWQSWIHIEDLARIFLHILENGLTGVYNAVAPKPVTNSELTERLAEVMGKKTWLPNVPAAALKLIMGEMSGMILSSQLVSSKKIQDTGFRFYYVSVSKALEDLLYKKTG
jgi:uncharacterized protein (TIGR01777 family)